MEIGVDAASDLVAVRAAELYYEEHKTQAEIAAILGTTRWQVGRLLAAARESGIVRIEIVHPRARRVALERRLCDTFGLRAAVVVGSTDDPAERDARVAQAAADYLVALRPVPRTLGISWGRTLEAVAERLPQGWANGVDVVQINGGVTLSRRPGRAAATAESIARRAGGAATLLPSPAILERRETKLAIEADRTVREVLELGAAASAYLYSAGTADHASVHVESGYLTPDEVDELVRKGAVGDVVGRYIDADGHIVDPGLDERTLGISLDRLRSAAIGILVVSGTPKHPIAGAVVNSGMCSVVITDDMTAEYLLDA